VLGDAVADTEQMKALIHLGHGAVGVVVILSPSPTRPSVTLALSFVTIWLLLSSVLLLATTVRGLRARYDYRMMRKYGRCATWQEAMRAGASEIVTEVSLVAKRSRGARRT
jgi:hypothetical protein